VPARHPHHPGDPRGQLGHRGTARLNGTLFGDLDGVGSSDDGPPSGSNRPRGFVIRTDGAARGNPGLASLGAALYDLERPDARDHRATPDATISEFLGVQTNNVAEYTGTVRALELARELGATEVHLLLDSKLIVEQLAGRWRVKDAKLIPLWSAARQTLGSFTRWTANHVPRAQNSVADALANEAIDRAAAGGPASVVRRPSDAG
jgi:probable phosphoglycerate mutase